MEDFTTNQLEHLIDCLNFYYSENDDKKNFFRIITKKPLTPSPEEIRINPRSKSAKLRVAEKI